MMKFITRVAAVVMDQLKPDEVVIDNGSEYPWVGRYIYKGECYCTVALKQLADGKVFCQFAVQSCALPPNFSAIGNWFKIKGIGDIHYMIHELACDIQKTLSDFGRYDQDSQTFDCLCSGCRQPMGDSDKVQNPVFKNGELSYIELAHRECKPEWSVYDNWDGEIV